MKLIHWTAIMAAVGIALTITSTLLLPDALPAGILLTVGGTTLTIGEWLHNRAEARRATPPPQPPTVAQMAEATTIRGVKSITPRLDGQILDDAQLTLPADTEALILCRRVPSPTDPGIGGLLVQMMIAADSPFSRDDVEEAILRAIVNPDWSSGDTSMSS